MTVDISKIKPGDEVTVRAVVRDPPRHYPDGWYVSAKAGTECFSFPCRWIVVHTPAPPKPLSVGDRVHDSGYPLGEIVAIHGEWAWMMAGGVPCSRRLCSLERAQ